MSAPAETTYRGVQWRRAANRSLSFYDADGGRWVRWEPGVDAPPLPPDWVPKRLARRPGWKSRWRLIPLVITVVAVAVAVTQVLHPSGNQVAKEAAASQAMLGKCLAQHGTAYGHPKYSSTPVPCGSPQASVKVISVVATSPGSPACPPGTTGVELAIYAGVRYPHVACIQALH